MDKQQELDKASQWLKQYAPSIKRIFESEDGKVLAKYCEGVIDLPSYIPGKMTFEQTTFVEGQRTAIRQLLNFRTYKDNTQ